MDTPAPDIFPGKQGSLQGAIAASPTLANVVFVSGDRQDNPAGFPNSSGCTNFTGNIFRGDAAKPAGSQFTSVVCNGANGTSPHADSRALTFDSTGTILLHGNDGGLFQLTNPDSPTLRKWLSFQGNVRETEIHNVAYDPLGKVVFSGNQDTGASVQSAPGSLTWSDVLQGDGGSVAVDADQTAHPGTSLRYVNNPNLGSFSRLTYDNSNTQSAFTAVALNIVSGAGTGQTLTNFDTTTQFVNPFVLNNINPARMLIGTASIYESSDKGDSLDNLGTAGASVSGLSYGSRFGGTSFPDVFYVGAGSQVMHRVTKGGTISILTTYPGSTTVSLVMDPQNYKHIYVLDNQGRVWASFDEGVTWEEATGDLLSKITQPRTLDIFSPPPIGANKRDQEVRLIVGGLGDVLHIRPRLRDRVWVKVDPKGLPHALLL
jgi:hypothetical protein